MPGKVTLVGAGPGDPGLLTRKGLEALQKAEVVVYDRLVSPAILAMMPEKAEHIDVGKQAFRHPVPQDQINQILLDKALEGKQTVAGDVKGREDAVKVIQQALDHYIESFCRA